MVNDLLTTDELASYLKVHEMTLYKLLQTGEIPAIKIGRNWRFKEETINKWLKTREEEGKTWTPTRKLTTARERVALPSEPSEWNISVDLEKREEDLFDVFDLKIELKGKVYRPK